MTWGAVIGGVVAAGGAAASANAAEDAAGQQADASRQGMLANANATASANRLLRPYRDSGENALNNLNYLMGYGSPEQMAHIQENFDEKAYRDWLIGQRTDTLKTQFKNPQKLQKAIERMTKNIDNRITKEGGWKMYNARRNAGSQTDGEFWKTRQGEGQDNGDGNFGFLQQRFNNDRFEKDPGYQFRMDEGNKAVEQSAAARGGLLSGAAMKAMQKYSQGFASNEYGNAYNRFTNDQNNLYQRATGMTDMGMRAAGATGANTINQGQQAAQSYSDIGNYGAAGTMGANNARQSGYQQAGNILMDAVTKYGNKNSGQLQDNGSGMYVPQGGYY